IIPAYGQVILNCAVSNGAEPIPITYFISKEKKDLEWMNGHFEAGAACVDEAAIPIPPGISYLIIRTTDAASAKLDPPGIRAVRIELRVADPASIATPVEPKPESSRDTTARRLGLIALIAALAGFLFQLRRIQSLTRRLE